MEIAYLENPVRLKELSGQQVGLEPIRVINVISPDEIISQFPLREDQIESGAKK